MLGSLFGVNSPVEVGLHKNRKLSCITYVPWNNFWEIILTQEKFSKDYLLLKKSRSISYPSFASVPSFGLGLKPGGFRRFWKEPRDLQEYWTTRYFDHAVQWFPRLHLVFEKPTGYQLFLLTKIATKKTGHQVLTYCFFWRTNIWTVTCNVACLFLLRTDFNVKYLMLSTNKSVDSKKIVVVNWKKLN